MPRTSSIGDAAAATRSANESASSRGAVTSTGRGEAEPNDARSSSPADTASETTAITIALRGPIFMNVCGALDGVSHTAVISSSGVERVALDAGHELASGTRRVPRTDAHSTSAPSISSGGSASPAGDDVPRLPPIVPRLRICGEPTVRDASASAGSTSFSSPCSISA